MEIILKFLIFLVLLLLIWHLLTVKYVNPYTMDLYIANKGAGKSTQLTKNLIKALKRGQTVYTNAKDINIAGVRIYDQDHKCQKYEHLQY